jgi:DNA processing protein
MDEAIFYNAIAISALGSYGEIKKIKKGKSTWKDAFEALEPGDAPLPDPLTEWDRLKRSGIELILSEEKRYPKILNEISHPPFAIYIKGNIAALRANKINLAIIGTRRASAEGKELSTRFARTLSGRGSTIISGLAFGIDGAAHQGCLEAEGTTIAVLARGLDEIYPQSNASLAKKILEADGALISEYPLNEPPLPYRFIERNRIISGLSQGVLVIEAPEGSGSLATARFALEQNRDVFVTPGNIFQSNFKGSHALIRQGATLVTDPDDILEAYGLEKTAAKKKRNIPSSTEETLILMVLEGSDSPADVDKIIQMTRLEPRIVNTTITFLLLKQFIKEVEGGYTI